MKIRLLVSGIFWTLSVASLVRAQSSYPMLMDTSPLAARIGETSELEIRSRYTMEGAYQVIVSGNGVTGTIVVEPETKSEAKPSVAMAAKPAAAKPVGAKPADNATAAKTSATPASKDSPTKDTAPKKPEAKPAVAPASAKPAEPVKKADLLKLKVRFTVDKDALPGVRDFRIATPQGVTTLGQLVLVRDPVVVEKGNNDALADANLVTLPATVCGVIEKAEDVDHYKFHVEAGTALTFHVRSARCEDKIHDLQIHVDPIITLKNSSGTVLAASDNYFFADPLLNYRFATAGDYYLEVRDVRYQGNVFWQYSIEINDRPFITNVFPLAVAPEKPTPLELVGFNLPTPPTVTVTLPGSLADGLQWIDLPLGARVASPAPVVVTHLPLVDRKPGNERLETAQDVTLPVGINGRISAPGEIHYYRFAAKKGEHFTFEVIARRHQSALDPILAVLNEKGARAIENDDAVWGRQGFGDSIIEHWTAPADGRYVLEIRDLHLQGGPQFVYFLKGAASEPMFLLETDSDKTIVTPGTAAAIFVRVYRKHGFTGEIQLAIDGLPRGVTASCGKILETGIDGCILLEAAKDAVPNLANVKITGRAKTTADGRTIELTSTPVPFQETYLPGGGRGVFPVEWQTVAVSRPLDITAVKLSPTEITLKPGGSQKITVTLERSAGFDKNITLDMLYRHLGGVSGNSLPAGVTIDEKTSKTLLTGSQTEGAIVLKAAADAKPVEKQLAPVIASASINFVMKMDYAGPPVYITVTKP